MKELTAHRCPKCENFSAPNGPKIVNEGSAILSNIPTNMLAWLVTAEILVRFLKQWAYLEDQLACDQEQSQGRVVYAKFHSAFVVNGV